ncbi:MAG: hypothetical protein HOA52_05535, partial [Flavobacteriales bacterium]|nr:hypothetical protein [Flavobacteriales bacterium]
KALKDEKTFDRASKFINTYSRYFPTIKSCFENSPPYNRRYDLPKTHVITNGEQYNIGCWINKTTTARTSD